MSPLEVFAPVDSFTVVCLYLVGLGGFTALVLGGRAIHERAKRNDPTTEVRGRDFILCDHPDDDEPEPMTGDDVDALDSHIHHDTPLPASDTTEGRDVTDEVNAWNLRQAEIAQINGKPWSDPNAELTELDRMARAQWQATTTGMSAGEYSQRLRDLAQRSAAWQQHLQAEDPSADPAYVTRLADAIAADESDHDDVVPVKPVVHAQSTTYRHRVAYHNCSGCLKPWPCAGALAATADPWGAEA